MQPTSAWDASLRMSIEFTMTCALPKPVRTFKDPITGVTIHQLTDGDEPSVHFYFTSPNWLAGGKYVLLLRRVDGAWNYFIAGADEPLRQLTHHPATPHPHRFMKHMHRAFYSAEVERMMWRMPAIHPTEPVIVFSWENTLRQLNLETGAEDVLYRFDPAESQQPKTPLHTEFTADGKDIIVVTNREALPGEPRLDPPEQVWHTSLRDESHIVSTIWRFDFERRTLEGPLFRSNGEQAHPLTCPWNPDLIMWTQYLHSCFYVMRRDGSDLRRSLDLPNHMLGHYNWDVANRRLTLIDTDWGSQTSRMGSLDLETRDLDHNVTWFGSVRDGASQWHQTPSPDGRWIVLDQPSVRIGDANGLSILDQQNDVQLPLCQLNCSWNTGLRDDDGQPIKSETLHPNPSWSPDGRYVLVDSDFGTGISQVYAVDMDTWQP